MKAGDRIEVGEGWVSFGLGLLLRTELVQSVAVEPASAANIPVVEPLASSPDVREWPQPLHLFQLEVKYAPRSAPYVVFVGTEKECRCKAGRLQRALRAAELRSEMRAAFRG